MNNKLVNKIVSCNHSMAELRQIEIYDRELYLQVVGHSQSRSDDAFSNLSRAVNSFKVAIASTGEVKAISKWLDTLASTLRKLSPR